jgi:hypothetical protein
VWIGALAAVVAAACAGSSAAVPVGDPTTVVHEAADHTIGAHTAKASISLGVAMGRGMQGAGVADFETGQADLVFVRTGTDARSHDRFHLVVDGSDGTLEGVAPTAVRGSLAALATSEKARIAPLDGLLLRPGAGLAVAMLRGAVKVLPYGGQEVEGTSTMRYSFLIDLSMAAMASPVSQRAALTSAAAAIGNIEFPGDAWIDRLGRVRRLQFSSNPFAQTTTTRPSLFTEDGEYESFIVLELSDFGVVHRG